MSASAVGVLTGARPGDGNDGLTVHPRLSCVFPLHARRSFPLPSFFIRIRSIASNLSHSHCAVRFRLLILSFSLYIAFSSSAMSTTIPESVSTTTSTTTTTTNATPSTSHTANPAAALDPLTTSTSTTTADLQQSAMHAASVVGSALKTAATHVQAAAVSTGAAISSAAHNVDAKYHVSDKVSDAASHVSAAIKHGNPVHAAKHASTAATIGDAERAKHEAGPLPAEAHAAGSSSAPSSSSTIASDSSFGHSQDDDREGIQQRQRRGLARAGVPGRRATPSTRPSTPALPP